MMRADTRTITINNKSQKEVFEYLLQVEKWPEWSVFAPSVTKDGNLWIVHTPQGDIKLRPAFNAELALLDHYLLVGDNEIFIPNRVVPNGSGAEVIITIFQAPNLTEDKYQEQIGWVEKELQNLKKSLEGC